MVHNCKIAQLGRFTPFQLPLGVSITLGNHRKRRPSPHKAFVCPLKIIEGVSIELAARWNRVVVFLNLRQKTGCDIVVLHLLAVVFLCVAG